MNTRLSTGIYVRSDNELNSRLTQKLYNIQQKIAYYSEIMMVDICPYVKNYYGYLIKKETEEAKKIINILCREKTKDNREAGSEKQFTLEELVKYDGSNGKPAYVAIEGIVYDVSLSSSWGGGTHFGLYAGKDLTKEFNACHNGDIKILESLSKVGRLKV